MVRIDCHRKGRMASLATRTQRTQRTQRFCRVPFRGTSCRAASKGAPMVASAGWFVDPWGEAELRWWTGAEWSAWTHNAAAQLSTLAPEIAGASTVPYELAESEARLSDLLCSADRIAVIDVETTGLYRADRVVEIAIVTMDATGRVIDEFDTLVNPLRDPGPTWIHGVNASMLVDAPPFEDIAHHLAARLNGAVVVGHNLPFDTRMVGTEFERAGIDVDWGVGLDTLRATGCKLGVACTEYGITLDGAHRALIDARATGQLLFAVCDTFACACEPVSASPLHHIPPRHVLTRDGFSEIKLDVPYLAELAHGVHADADVAAYVALLDRAVSDLQLTSAERAELIALAQELGLDDQCRDRAHRQFLNGLIDAALEDSIVTDDELDQLCRVAALLDLDAELVTRRTGRYRVIEETLTLEPGLVVCFTGAAVDELGKPIDRATVLEVEARERGLIPKSSCTKRCGLVIAADTASQSSKVDTARRLGVPVAALADYLRTLITGDPLPVTRMMPGTGIAQVCDVRRHLDGGTAGHHADLL